ncbi:MAG: hypothetical protein ACRDWA_05145 [Acidimicrobiia bacterium]
MTAPDDPIELCRGFTTHQWRALLPQLTNDDPDAWDCAIEVFRRRINERYLSSIQALIDADCRADSRHHSERGDCDSLPQDTTAPVVPGFAITALCCLLVETLQSFREGSSRNTKRQFERFLARPAFRGEFAEAVASRFYTGVRSGILHEAETRKWTIWRTSQVGKIVEALGEGRYLLYRNQFFDAIKQEFNDYLADLQSPDSGLRAAFLKQMKKIVAAS